MPGTATAGGAVKTKPPTDLAALLDAPAPSGREHRYVKRPAARHLSEALRQALHRLDALADRLAVVTAELRTHEDPAAKAAAVEEDAERLVAAAVAGDSRQPTRHVTEYESRLRDLRAERDALAGGRDRAEQTVLHAIAAAWDGMEDGDSGRAIRAEAQPALGRYIAAVAALEQAEADLDGIRGLALWFARNGSVRIDGLEPEIELRRGTHYIRDIVDTVNNTLAVMPAMSGVAIALRDHVAVLLEPKL